jgi:hypothetical protein
MKFLILLLALSITLPVHAQITKKRQSMTSFGAIFDRIFHNDIPYQGLVLDLEDSTKLSILESAAHTQNLRLPNLESNFIFTNTKTEFEKLFKPDMGLCRGMSSLRRKFRLLAVFDPKNEKESLGIPDRVQNLKGFQQFYKKIVKNIRDRKVTIVPGYANLREFSADPDLSDMIKMQVLNEWKKKNFARGTGLGKVLRGSIRHSTYEELLEMRSRVEAFQKINLNTIVWLNQKLSGWIHALEAVEVTPVAEDGSFKFTFWNDKFTEVDKAYSTMTVTADAKMIYDDGIHVRELNSGGVAKENDGEMLDISEKLQEYYRNKVQTSDIEPEFEETSSPDDEL